LFQLGDAEYYGDNHAELEKRKGLGRWELVRQGTRRFERNDGKIENLHSTM